MLRRARVALMGAGASSALLALTWAAAFHTWPGVHFDRAIFNGFAGLQRPRVNHLANLIAHLCDPTPFVLFAAVILLVALVRRRPRMALAAGVILLGANATTELLKPLLAEPRVLPGEPVAVASWPSGHATAAMSLALCAVLVAPARGRPVVAALGAAFAVAVSYSFLTLGWHFPSDVLGGFLVAAAWTLLTIAALRWFEARRGRDPITVESRRQSLREVLSPAGVAVAATAALAALVAVTRPHAVIVYVRTHEAFIVGASTIAALGLVLATAVTLSVRR